MDRVWRVRFRWLNGWPPTYFGPLTQVEANELIDRNFGGDTGQLFEVTVTRGDFGGEIDCRAKAQAAAGE